MTISLLPSYVISDYMTWGVITRGLRKWLQELGRVFSVSRWWTHKFLKQVNHAVLLILRELKAWLTHKTEKEVRQFELISPVIQCLDWTIHGNSGKDKRIMYDQEQGNKLCPVKWVKKAFLSVALISSVLLHDKRKKQSHAEKNKFCFGRNFVCRVSTHVLKAISLLDIIDWHVTWSRESSSIPQEEVSGNRNEWP